MKPSSKNSATGWPEFANEAQVADRWHETIRQSHRLEFAKRLAKQGYNV